MVRVTMKRINGKRITTIQVANRFYKSVKPCREQTAKSADIFAELGIIKV